MNRKTRGPELLSQQAFGEMLLNRVQKERPDLAVELINPYFLLVGTGRGKQRVVPLLGLYQNYCAAPVEMDTIVEEFLASCVYEEQPAIVGTFDENRERILPQIVPPSLVEFSIGDRQPLVVIPFAAGLSVAFVVDEPERYCYINQSVMEQWRVKEADLLAVALSNLRHISVHLNCQQVGTGEHAVFTFENFDGYDASRLLLSRVMTQVSARVAGQTIIAIPHRDVLMVFGDADPEFVAMVSEKVHQDFESHSYPITSKLLTWDEGDADLYEPDRRVRVIN